METFLLFLTVLLSSVTFSDAQSNDSLPTGEDKVYTFVDQMPEFPGGRDAMFQFISDSLNYPPKAIEDKIEGTVYVNLIVDTLGNSENVKVLRGIREDLDAEAIRVVEIMDGWTPGSHNGRKRRVSYNLPIKFVLK